MPKAAPTSFPAVIALGSNLGDRRRFLRAAVERMRTVIRIVRISSIYETDPIDAPIGSRPFLNAVVAGVTRLSPEEVLQSLHGIEQDMGRRRAAFHAPRVIDLDLILYDARILRSPTVTLPHPRFREREFVLAPLRELNLGWRDPQTGVRIAAMRGEGAVVRVGRL